MSLKVVLKVPYAQVCWRGKGQQQNARNVICIYRSPLHNSHTYAGQLRLMLLQGTENPIWVLGNPVFLSCQ